MKLFKLLLGLLLLLGLFTVSKQLIQAYCSGQGSCSRTSTVCDGPAPCGGIGQPTCTECHQVTQNQTYDCNAGGEDCAVYIPTSCAGWTNTGNCTLVTPTPTPNGCPAGYLWCSGCNSCMPNTQSCASWVAANCGQGGGVTPTPGGGGTGSCTWCAGASQCAASGGTWEGPGSSWCTSPLGGCCVTGSGGSPASPFCRILSTASSNGTTLSVGETTNLTIQVDGTSWPPGATQIGSLGFRTSTAGIIQMQGVRYSDCGGGYGYYTNGQCWPYDTTYFYNACCSSTYGPHTYAAPGSFSTIRANAVGTTALTFYILKSDAGTTPSGWNNSNSCSATITLNIVPACTPSCATQCGQSDGCGGTCGSGQVGTVGAWSACTLPNFTRSRDIDSVCNPGVTYQTEACTGSVTGTIFDASNIDSCALIGSAPKVSGGTVTFNGTNSPAISYQATTDGSGNYSRSGMRIPDTYDMSLSGPAGYIYSTPKLYCDGSLSVSLSTQGQTASKRFGLWSIFGGWFQTWAGGAYGKTGISVEIPASCGEAGNFSTCNDYSDGTTRTPLTVRGTGGTAGTSYFGSGLLDLGSATNASVSQDGRKAASSYSERKTGYDYFNLQSAQFQNTQKTNWGGSGKPSGASNGLYKSTVSGTLTINGTINPVGNEVIVIFHDGDVSINGDIVVPQGSFLAVVSSGSIRVQSNVTGVQGVYIADDNFEVLSTGNTATEQRFTGEGTFVGLTGVNLLRDRGTTNNSQSSEFFLFRADFVINAPFGLKLPQFVWREIAP